jgi:hypothetical protein
MNKRFIRSLVGDQFLNIRSLIFFSREGNNIDECNVDALVEILMSASFFADEDFHSFMERVFKKTKELHQLEVEDGE